MNWIQNISSTLKTWVFKKKVLVFSSRFERDPQACFYCPEMCRFSCPVAENLRDNTVTPRGKMSLIHLLEKGNSLETITGTRENYLWVLEQCTGCGRCTEHCVYEIDVSARLRKQRELYFLEHQQLTSFEQPQVFAGAFTTKTFTESKCSKVECKSDQISGTVLLCEKSKKQWWLNKPNLLSELHVDFVEEVSLPSLDWSWGRVSKETVSQIKKVFSKCKKVWVESPETAWFLMNCGLDVRHVWQGLFRFIQKVDWDPDTTFHESYHLTRLMPNAGYSIPMYERGLMPFHRGVNVLDCGGEGFYKKAHPQNAKGIGERFLFDLTKDGRKLSKLVCQSHACIEHLKPLTQAQVSYWLDYV